MIGFKETVVNAANKFGFLGRVMLKKVKESINSCFGTVEIDRLLAFKGVCASIILKQSAKPMLCAAANVPLPPERRVNQTTVEISTLGILTPIEAGGDENHSPVVWAKKFECLLNTMCM